MGVSLGKVLVVYLSLRTNLPASTLTLFAPLKGLSVLFSFPAGYIQFLLKDKCNISQILKFHPCTRNCIVHCIVSVL